MKTLERIKRDHRVKDAWSEGGPEEDGYWISLNPGWRSITTETHSVHEWTIKDLLRDFRDIEPCSCEECMQALPNTPG